MTSTPLQTIVEHSQKKFLFSLSFFFPHPLDFDLIKKDEEQQERARVLRIRYRKNKRRNNEMSAIRSQTKKKRFTECKEERITTNL
jgi:hypothetical protein